MISNAQSWYIVKNSDGTCQISGLDGEPGGDWWGPFRSQEEAIARRVGLIRAGKCQPQ